MINLRIVAITTENYRQCSLFKMDAGNINPSIMRFVAGTSKLAVHEFAPLIRKIRIPWFFNHNGTGSLSVNTATVCNRNIVGISIDSRQFTFRTLHHICTCFNGTEIDCSKVVRFALAGINNIVGNSRYV